MKKLMRDNGLSIVFLGFFFFSIVGQVINGLKEHNQQMKELGGKEITMPAYLKTGHFFQSTFENWESEFFQMALYVILTMFLFQKGSSESKDPDKEEEVDREPDPNRKNAPWPVKKGGLVLAVYRHSLCYALTLLFLISFLLHWYGSLKDYNEERSLRHLPLESATQYLSNSRLWFESFQNWESEFLSIFVMVVLSIYLREKGSAQSKPVDAPNRETGE